MDTPVTYCQHARPEMQALEPKQLERVVDPRCVARATHGFGRLGQGERKQGAPLQRLAVLWTIQHLVVASPGG
jgi:hypothetical protein